MTLVPRKKCLARLKVNKKKNKKTDQKKKKKRKKTEGENNSGKIRGKLAKP